MTKVVNKHLLDVFDEPMIHFPLRALARAGIDNVTVVTGKEMDQFQALLGDGDGLGLHLSYAQQDGEMGIADALAKAWRAVGDDRMIVILGDNLFEDDLSPYVEAFSRQASGAKLLLHRVSDEDARRFGVATIESERIVSIAEKPQTPASDLVVTGCYFYDASVFDIIGGLTPSARGELEITDVNNAYIERGDMTFDILPGWWTDAGTPLSKLRASNLIAHGKGEAYEAT
jgi:glucose-1-phosphate thymidylyltransferase